MEIAASLSLTAFVGLFLLNVIFVARRKEIVAERQERLRTARLRDVADELGLQFEARADNLVPAVSRLKLNSQGRATKITNLLHGTTEDVAIGIFDYQDPMCRGDDYQASKWSVISFRSPLLNLPEFRLRPESLLHKIGQVFGHEDIDFESNPDFSKAYLLRGSDETWIRLVFDDEVLAFFEQTTGACCEGDRDRLIYYRRGVRVEPARIRSFMDEGFGVYLLLRSRCFAADDPDHRISINLE